MLQSVFDKKIVYWYCFYQSLIKRLSIGIVFIVVVVANNSLT